jgi:hypothetical protein
VGGINGTSIAAMLYQVVAVGAKVDFGIPVQPS